MPNSKKVMSGIAAAVSMLIASATNVSAQQVIDFNAPNFGDSDQFCKNNFGGTSSSSVYYIPKGSRLIR
jgi:hypothetical protein